ncbi:MAG: hypothetical protein Q9170_004976 [Blastenia crenularia]
MDEILIANNDGLTSITATFDAYRESLRAYIRLLKQRIAYFDTHYNTTDTPSNDLLSRFKHDTEALLRKAEGWLGDLNSHRIARIILDSLEDEDDLDLGELLRALLGKRSKSDKEEVLVPS